MKAAMRMVLGVFAASLAAAPAIADDAIDGKKVWDKSCAGCHAMFAPKTADKAAWAPFVKLGADAVTASVIKGKGTMPPKGGAKTEADVRASVEYILDKMK
jgi:cytochrome c5